MEVTQYSHFDVNLILSYIKIVLDCQYGLESNKLCKIIIRLTCLDIHWIRMGYPNSSGIRGLGALTKSQGEGEREEEKKSLFFSFRAFLLWKCYPRGKRESCGKAS